MVKKIKPAADTPGAERKSAGLPGGHLTASVKDSAQQIWLAGMGAFSKAQEEGTKVFEALVKEGLTLQKKTQAVAEEKLGEVTGHISAMADTVTSKAGQNWDKLETIFEQRTAKALGKLGVPTAKDVQALSRRVDELAAALAKLGTPARPAPAPKAPKSPSSLRGRKVSAVPEAAPAAAPAANRAPAKRARKSATP